MFSGICRFHNIHFEFCAYGSNYFTDCWQNRLNPFSVKSIPEDSALVRLENSTGNFTEYSFVPVSEMGEGFFRMKVYQDENGDTLWEYVRYAKNEIYLRLWMNQECSDIKLIEDNSQSGGNLPYICLGYLIPAIMLKHGSIIFHGVLMEHDGRGIIISAPSGFGKTTHAHIWRDQKRALIINGDRAACCIENGRWIGYGIPWAGSS